MNCGSIIHGHGVCPDIAGRLRRVLIGLTFWPTATAVLAGPWFFGAWVTWWFWPFAACLFLSTLSSGLLLILRGAACGTEPAVAVPSAASEEKRVAVSALSVVTVLALVTTVYAAIRAGQAPVRMDAERSLLLFLLPLVVAVQAIFVFDPPQRKRLLILFAANFLLLGLYGIVNHWVCGSRFVLWAPGYAQYQIGNDRATGSYFCPDHFAGIMELGLALGMALLLARGHGWRFYVAGAALAGVALTAIVMSKSRGAAFAVVAMVLVGVAAGLYQRSVLKRWSLRVAVLASVAIAAGVVWHAEPAYVKRFREYFGNRPLAGSTFGEGFESLRKRIEPLDRYQMISGALRGWQMAPVFGIGPGMHQHYWPRTGASSDGDRAVNRWPTYLNNSFHSFEAHSDWAQLLEEYGLIGFGLVLVTGVAVGVVLFRNLLAEGRRWRRTGRKGVPCAGMDPYAVPLAGLLALTAMAVHSLGDFNLQMPATGWVLAAIVAISLARDGGCIKE